MKIEITKKDGKWLINGKTYSETSKEEKQFFDEFILAMKWANQMEQHDRNLKKAS